MGGVRGVRGASVGALVLVWGGYNGRLHELPLLKLEVPLFKSESPASAPVQPVGGEAPDTFD